MAIHEKCHLISVIGGKGGVGKSVFSANLTVALMNELRARVLLIDLDSKSCGDQNIITGLRPKKTVADLANFTGAITPQSLDTMITTHPSGFHYLGAVLSPEQTLNASAALFKKQISTLSQFYNFIIVDLGCDYTDLQLSMIEDSSAILTITTPEVLAVNQTKRVIHDLMAATVPGDFFQVVINNFGRSSLDPKLVSQNLGRPIIGLIPQDDTTTYSSVQRSTPFILTSPQAPISQAYYDIVRRLTGGILQKLKIQSRPSSIKTKSSELAVSQLSKSSGSANSNRKAQTRELTPITQLKLQIHSALIREMDLKKDMSTIQGDSAKEQELRNKTQKIISQLVDKFAPSTAREERSQIIKQVLDESLGLGPLEDLLADPTVTEIMVNGADKIYVEKSGKIQLSPITFTSNLQLRNVIERIVTPLGRRIDEKTPYCDARLHDGSRVNAVIEPLAIDGPAVTIRKFPTERITINDYVTRFNSMTQPMADFLRVCVEQGLNIIISGGTGSGKTTLLNVLSGFIPSSERIVTVEDAAELQLKQDHVVRLETRPANMEGSGEISIRDLVKNALRMRPDRIVVGECRDGAALDMLSAMNTGHDGSMTTVHSNNPREAISRLETLCLMSGMELPAKAIREQIASAVNLIVQISRFSDGSRKILSITEVVGIQSDTVTLQEIFRFKEEGFDKNRKVIGQFQPMGLIPTFIEKFEQRGITVPRNLFTTQSSNSNNSSPAKVTATAQPVARAVPTPVPTKKVGGGSSR
ncbi:MAG: Flp pilus assembly complex ATPase component TadA [Bdellovibrionales bacterium]|nr:Flp pilus assembly complex ATPase component TadA [Bdellovibrionales bacterium]